MRVRHGANLVPCYLCRVRTPSRRRDLYTGVTSTRSSTSAECLYDNAKVVVVGRDQSGRPEWNSRLLDFRLQTGFEMRLCRPYCAQTKGRVESGSKYELEIDSVTDALLRRASAATLERLLAAVDVATGWWRGTWSEARPRSGMAGSDAFCV